MTIGNESCKHNRKSERAGAIGDFKSSKESRGQGSERFGKARDGSGGRVSCQLVGTLWKDTQQGSQKPQVETG